MSLDQLDYIKGEIEKNILAFKSSRSFYRKNAFYAYISSSFLAGITTIILGLNLEGYDLLTKRISLIITSLITFISALNAFYSPKELWLSYNKSLILLYELKLDITYYEKAGTPPDPEKIDEFKNRFQNIMNEMNKSWFKTRETIGK